MGWGSCVLRVDGEEFDPDAFLEGSTLKPYEIYRRGQPRATSGRRASLRHESAGFKCDVSNADDLSEQVRDAIAFLRLHKNDLARLPPTVEEPQLDFGYQCRIGGQTVMQGEYLPRELLGLCGESGLGIALSLYPGSLTAVEE